MSPTRTTRVMVAPAGLILALVLVLLGAPAASAHDVVESSDPAEGAALAAAPARVSITLSEAPQGPNALTVVGPDGRRYEQGAVTTAGETVSVAVGPLGPAGTYEIGYRVVSSDGHPVTGAIPFTLTAPGPSAGAPAARPAPGASGSPDSSDAAAGQPQPSSAAGRSAPASDDEQGGLPAWPFVVLAIVVVVGAVALALRRRVG